MVYSQEHNSNGLASNLRLQRPKTSSRLFLITVQGRLLPPSDGKTLPAQMERILGTKWIHSLDFTPQLKLPHILDKSETLHARYQSIPCRVTTNANSCSDIGKLTTIMKADPQFPGLFGETEILESNLQLTVAHGDQLGTRRRVGLLYRDPLHTQRQTPSMLWSRTS